MRAGSFFCSKIKKRKTVERSLIFLRWEKKKKWGGMGREKKTYGLVGSFSLKGEGFFTIELVKVLVRFEKVSEGCWHICLCSAGV